MLLLLILFMNRVVIQNCCYCFNAFICNSLCPHSFFYSDFSAISVHHCLNSFFICHLMNTFKSLIDWPWLKERGCPNNNKQDTEKQGSLKVCGTKKRGREKNHWFCSESKFKSGSSRIDQETRKIRCASGAFPLWLEVLAAQHGQTVSPKTQHI